MEIFIEIIQETANSTISTLSLHKPLNSGGSVFCYILEDGFRATKEHGKTRIPAGRYELERVYQGRFFEAYKKLFGHAFAIGVKNVPNFSLIRMHAGVTVEDTDGCPLTGSEYLLNPKTNCFEVRKSRAAYQRLYRNIASQMLKGKVFINVVRTPQNVALATN